MLAACADFASLAQATRGIKYKVGNQVVVRLNDGRIVEAKIRAVIEQPNGLHRKWIIGTMRPR